MAKKTLTLNRDGFKTVWRNGEEKREIDVDVYKDDKLVLEWGYAKVAGNSIMGNAAIYLDQAILQAKVEMEKE